MTIQPLLPEVLYRHCDPTQFTFHTTADLETFDDIIGQTRALEAIQFGIGIPHEGFNLFVLGPNGTGKQTAVSQYLHQTAPHAPTPDDWCYVYNFDQPYKPVTLRLRPGRATLLQTDMKRLVDDLFTVLPGIFTSEEYQAQQKAIAEELKERQNQALEDLRNIALTHQIALIRTPSGFAFAPLKNGEVVRPDEFMTMPPEEQQSIEREVGQLQNALQNIMEQIPHWQHESQNKLRQLHQEVVQYAIAPLFTELHKKYDDADGVRNYLNAVQHDVTENFGQFLDAEESPLAAMMGGETGEGPKPKRPPTRYQVNVMVDHSQTQGAPIVFEDKPTYVNLMGRIEYLSQMGTLLTDFTLVKPGAIHRANGGYLILDARRVLLEAFSWEALKQTIRSRQIRVESPAQLYSLISTVSLEPEPIPCHVKVILLGERALYYLLNAYDPDFGELFKVAADFEDDMPRDESSHRAYAQLIGNLARKESLRHFDRPAVSRIIEHSARLSGDATKLTTHMQSISDLLREADYWANQNDHTYVTVADVQQALDAQMRRASRIHERIQEAILQETILIDTSTARVGQINGLAVYGWGNYAFGRPSRITARVRLGKGEVIDIERQVDMGGPIHSKGVLILAGFLGARYAAERPFPLSATLVFEQSYAGVDGDSASSAELYALLSALAEAPINQALAVTGSVNQHGQVQAIGGVNEKIEGFFDLCQMRGLNGTQGVLIPQANVRHLMLRQDVVTAVSQGQFHIYPISHIDEGIELLTGISAGSPNDQGEYPPHSINGRVTRRLITFAEKQRAYTTASENKNHPHQTAKETESHGREGA